MIYYKIYKLNIKNVKLQSRYGGIYVFRTLIYFDKKKITEYKSLIERKKAIELKSVKISNEKTGKAQIPIASGGITGKSEMDGQVLENYLLDCEEFENILSGREDYLI